MQGWIKLHRKTIESTVFMDADLLKLWLYCLLKATHKPRTIMVEKQAVELLPGQFITGRFELEADYNKGTPKRKRVSGVTLQRWLVKLQTMGNLNIKPTPKYTIVTVLNWVEYQEDEQQMINRCTTDDQQMITNKNVLRMIKNEKKEDQDRKTEEVPYQKVVDLYHEFCPGLSKVIKLNTNRKTLIRARFKNHGLDGLEILFKKAGASNFLQGINDRAWKANFDWLLKDSNAIKVLEGNYDNRASPTAEKRSREDFVYTEPPKQDLSKFSFLEEDNHE